MMRLPLGRKLIVQKQKHVALKFLKTAGKPDGRLACERTACAHVRQECQIVEAPEERVKLAEPALVRRPDGKREPAPVNGAGDETGIAEPVGDVVVKVDLLHVCHYGR